MARLTYHNAALAVDDVDRAKAPAAPSRVSQKAADQVSVDIVESSAAMQGALASRTKKPPFQSTQSRKELLNERRSYRLLSYEGLFVSDTTLKSFSTGTRYSTVTDFARLRG